MRFLPLFVLLLSGCSSLLSPTDNKNIRNTIKPAAEWYCAQPQDLRFTVYRPEVDAVTKPILVRVWCPGDPPLTWEQPGVETK